MPFNKKNAAENGRKGGSYKKPFDSVRNKQIQLSVNKREMEMINNTAAVRNLSRTETIIRAVAEYYEQIIWQDIYAEEFSTAYDEEYTRFRINDRKNALINARKQAKNRADIALLQYKINNR
jgi:uncharacterized protein (DUF1778 family)